MRCAVLGAMCALGFSPPAAALTALTYRFPVFMAGYVSGPAGVWPAMFGAVFYLLLGGFIVVGGLGAAAGLLAERWWPDRAVTLTTIAAAVIAVLGALSLAVLEYFIGHW